MYSILVILAVIISVLLALIVLIQESKGGGLASNFSGSTNVLGYAKTTDVVEKATWSLAGLLVVICIISTLSLPRVGTATSVTDGMTNTATPAAQGATQGAAGGSAAPATQGTAQ